MVKDVLRIPEGVRLISWATAVRFIGWGFAEFFIPVFLLSFGKNYTDTGLLRAIYDIVFLLSLPIISHFANRTSSRRIILIGLFIYPFISMAYFMAGAYGLVIFIIIARFLNGISYALDSVGKRTYMRRLAHDHVGEIFGYYDTISNFWWLLAGVAGLFLVKIIPIHVLLLLIIPTTMIAIRMIDRLPEEKVPRKVRKKGIIKEVFRDYEEMFGFIRRWSLEQKYIASLYALMGILFVVVSFFVPLVSFVNSQSYTTLFLITAFATLPYLLGVPLGYLADQASESLVRIIALISVALLATLSFVSSIYLVYLVVFLISLCVYFVMLVLERLATLHETRFNMGSLSGAFLSIYQITQVLAPILVGFFIDSISISFAIITVSLIGFLTILPMFILKIEMFEARG